MPKLATNKLEGDVRKCLDKGPRNASWLGHHIQDELIQIMADTVLSSITAELQEASFYTIIADETKDISKPEQLSIVLRYFIMDCP